MRFSTDTVKLHGVGTDPAVTLRCLGDLSLDMGLGIIGPDSGNTYDEVRFLGQRVPEGSFGAYALKQILNNIPLLGVKCITVDGTHPGVEFYGQGHDPCGTNGRVAAGSHMKVATHGTTGKAFLAVTRIGGSKGQSAMATVRAIICSTDGNGDPDIRVYNATLPTSFVVDEEYVIGTPTIESVAMDNHHVLSWQIDTGIAITPIIGAGSVYATTVDHTKTRPRITIEHDDPTWAQTSKIAFNGKKVLQANTKFPLIKRTPFAGLEALASAVHIRIAAEGMAYNARHYQASGSAVGTGQIVIECSEPAGGVPLVVTVDTANP